MCHHVGILRKIIFVICSQICSPLIEICLYLVVALLLVMSRGFVPVFEAIASGNLFEIWERMVLVKFFSDEIFMVFLTMLLWGIDSKSFLFIVRAHIDAKMHNAVDCILPCECALAVMDLWDFSSNIAASGPDFELLFLVQHSFSSSILSAFLSSTYYFCSLQCVIGRLLFVTFHLRCLWCPTRSASSLQ